MIKVGKEYFLYGFFFHLCINSLWQDMLGLERYIEEVKLHWVSSAYTVPIAVVLLIFILLSMGYDRYVYHLYLERQKKKEEKRMAKPTNYYHYCVLYQPNSGTLSYANGILQSNVDFSEDAAQGWKEITNLIKEETEFPWITVISFTLIQKGEVNDRENTNKS